MDSCTSLPLDLMLRIVSYSDASTLASLDLTCQEMSQQHTNETWARLAQRRFGCEAASRRAGKESWRTGISLTSRYEPPIVLWNPREVAKVAANEHSMVVVASNAVGGGARREHQLQIRDSRTAEIQTERRAAVMNGENRACEMTICGRAGNEIIVISTDLDDVIAFHHDGTGQTMLHRNDGNVDLKQTLGLLGKEDLLLVFRSSNIYFYQPNPSSLGCTSEPQLQHLCTMPFYEDKPVMLCSTIAWSSPCKTEFGFSYEDCRVCIWSLYDTDGAAIPEEQLVLQPQCVETFFCKPPENNQPDDDADDVMFDNSFSSLAFNGDFVVAIREPFAMVVLDRPSGTIMHTISSSELRLPSDSGGIFVDVFSNAFSIHGSYLMSAFHLDEEFTLAVWDLRSGTASFRPVPAIPPRRWGALCPDVVRLSHWDYLAFCVPVVAGPLLLWGFPKSREDKKHFDTIRSREARKHDGM